MAESLPLFAPEPSGLPPVSKSTIRAIEDGAFPFETLSAIAGMESWRKEIHRPVYHVHKWWAQRLGSVFRAIVLGTFAPAESDIGALFYDAVRLTDVTVLDPFMGSGTTVGEVLKLGGRAIGFDINPVAYTAARNALDLPKRGELLETFRAIEQDVAPTIRRYYEARLPDGRKALALYYFWVKHVACPGCHAAVDLFSSYVFVDHAYRDRHPDARALCPGCGAVNLIRFDARSVRCATCRSSFDPRSGPASGARATCPECATRFPIARAVRDAGKPPRHRLYAKLVLTESGNKMYLPADDFDRRLYERAARELKDRGTSYPVVEITPGYNTNQVLKYCYTRWHEMFNSRQLLCLGVLADRIRDISDVRLRETFCCLFSGVLEFNNMFASFKGEGTGAVRHMFYHHILKPERTPLEANLWGTPKSSGAFSTLFRSRILRAFDYCENPFELRLGAVAKGRPSVSKVHDLSVALFHDAATTYQEFQRGKTLYLGCRDSSVTDIADGTVDAVITDPPFFDNVHYSELADFFHVWQRHILGARGAHASATTRSVAEVQQGDAGIFMQRLTEIWRECNRVLKVDGLLVFTYHHSRSEGWRSVLASLVHAGFWIAQTHPVKSEMSVATPKHQAREPIDFDVIIVCRKRAVIGDAERQAPSKDLLRIAYRDARRQLARLRKSRFRLSRNDLRVVLMARAIAQLSGLAPSAALEAFDAVEPLAERAIARLCRALAR